MLRANRHGIRDTIQEIELLDTDRVDLVEAVYHRDVAVEFMLAYGPSFRLLRIVVAFLPSTLGLENIDQIIDSRIAANRDVRRVDPVFAHDSLDLVMVDVRQRHTARDVQATLILLLEDDVGGLLVDSDSEALQLRLNNPLVRQRLVHI